MHKLNRKLNRRVRGVSPDALQILSDYDYPGNVRELENLLERAVILTAGDVIQLGALPAVLRPPTAAARPGSDIPLVSPDWRQARDFVLRAFEERFIRQALREAGGNVTPPRRGAPGWSGRASSA